MNVRELKSINVLNYNEFTVVVTTKTDSYALPPASDGNPSLLPLTFDEISYINSNSEVFKTGILRFPKEYEEVIYTELKILDWKEILSNDEIKDIILNPTVEGLSKILKIQNIANFERVKGIFVKLKNENKYDISMRVEDLIRERDAELRAGIRNSKIIIRKSDTMKMVSTDEVNSLKEQNKLLQEQLNQMQKMIEQMMKTQVVSQELTQENENETKTERKKVGRPSNKNNN